jgi:hypothetical protein
LLGVFTVLLTISIDFAFSIALSFYLGRQTTIMKKIPVSILLLCSFQLALNASTVLPEKTSRPSLEDVLIPLMNSGKSISVKDFLELTPTSYKQLTGKSLSLAQRIDLAAGKHYIKKMLRKDSSVDVEKMRRRGFFGAWQWHWGGFALGLFLSFLGPIVALFFNDDYKWDRFWTAMHTAVYVGLIIALIVALSA